MKKIIVCFILIFTTLFASFSFAAVPFTDVANTHWAYNYIDKMQASNIINGYPDNTFKPENQVKTGEFFKMACMILFPQFEYKGAAQGEHWAKPYAEPLGFLDGRYRRYDNAKLESYITREEAAEVIADMYELLQGRKNKSLNIDSEQKSIKRFSDEAQITGIKKRRSVNLCTQYNLINGFEDGSFRPKEGLTRAQASKLLSVVQE